MRNLIHATALVFVSSVFLASESRADSNAEAHANLGDLSIEELMDITVTSVSRGKQSVSDSPAAIFVITAEDIRRLGANSLPEILRIAPGMDVSRIDSSRWAISARGFNGFFANKLLVLIDGRSIYTPLFSGIFWAEQDTLIEDIERIEIIRGPGATLWGANAVNGVINIITKHSKDTQGALITSGAGNKERAFGAFRSGSTAGDGWTYRAYGKYNNRDDSRAVGGGDSFDAWSSARAGFRSDFQRSADTSLMITGDGYYGNEQLSSNFPVPSQPPFERVQEDTYSNGGSLVGRLQHTLEADSKIEVQAYADLTGRDNSYLDTTQQTYDLEFQHRLRMSPTNELIWGTGFRNYENRIDANRRTIRVDDHLQRLSLVTAFVQDEFALIPEKLIATIGTKLEHQDLTGLEVQPSVRLRWVANKHETFWAAVSRATNTPAIVDDDLSIELSSVTAPDGTPVLTTLRPNHEKPSENLIALELGYRRELTPSLSMDLATFANHYSDFNTYEPAGRRLVTDDGAPYIANEVFPSDLASVRSYGSELAFEWRPVSRLRLSGSYSFIAIDEDMRPGSQNLISGEIERINPKHIAQLRSFWNITPTVQLDTALRYVDHRPDYGIRSYAEGDVRLGWAFAPNADLSLIGQNLFDAHHQENISNAISITPSDVVRGGFAKLTVEF